MAFDYFDNQAMLERFQSKYGASNAKLELHPGQSPEFTLTVMFPDSRSAVVVKADEAEDAESMAVELLEEGLT